MPSILDPNDSQSHYLSPKSKVRQCLTYRNLWGFILFFLSLSLRRLDQRFHLQGPMVSTRRPQRSPKAHSSPGSPCVTPQMLWQNSWSVIHSYPFCTSNSPDLPSFFKVFEAKPLNGCLRNKLPLIGVAPARSFRKIRRSGKRVWVGLHLVVAKMVSHSVSEAWRSHFFRDTEQISMRKSSRSDLFPASWKGCAACATVPFFNSDDIYHGLEALRDGHQWFVLETHL